MCQCPSRTQKTSRNKIIYEVLALVCTLKAVFFGLAPVEVVRMGAIC